MALTPEERAEIEAYEADEKQRATEREDADERQHLDAVRLRKKYESSGKRHGEDFLVLETNRGCNLVVRTPHELEVQSVEGKDDPELWEKYICQIVEHPPAAEFVALKVKWPGIANAVVHAGNVLIGGAKVLAAKK